ncbi:MAG: BatA domain-containing protein, partial [bacterium]
MLSWLNNIYLFGLFLAGIPILIHFLTRKKLSIVKFSAIRFIDEIQKTRMRSLKLKQIILLIIRMLIIACFVIGFARPAIRIQFKSAGGSHERTSVIILLDNSLSTSQEIGGIDIFTLQKNAVHRIISLLKPGDELSLAVFNDDVYPVTSHFTRGFKRVLRVVDTLKVSWKSTSIKNALTFAADELKFASNANREIYIITDNRASGWKDVVPERINFERTRVFVILFNGNIDNLSVSSVSFPPQLIEIDKPFTLNYTVTNHSARAYKAVVSNLFIDNDRVAQDEITSFGAGVVSSELVGYISKGGLHSGYVTIDNDALKADDIYYFSFKVPEICNVLLLGGQERIYLRLALSPTDSSSFFRVKEMDYVEGMKERLDEYDVFVLSAPPPLPDDFMFRLKQSVMSGKGLVLFLGTKSDLKALGNFLQNRISFLGAVGGTGGYLNIGRVLYNHPIFQVFKSLKGIPRVEFYKIVQTIANENVIASFTNDNPFIIETMLGGGKCIVITSSVEPEWSNLYLSSFFIPFIQRSCQYVAGDVAQFDK